MRNEMVRSFCGHEGTEQLCKIKKLYFFVTYPVFHCLYKCNILKYKKEKERKMKKVLELVEFKLADGADERKFLQASENFQNEFLNEQPGLVSRNLIRMGGIWGDLAMWDSMENAEAVEGTMKTSESAGRYNSFIDSTSVKMKHFEIIQ